MAIEVETKDCSMLGDAEIEEMAKLTPTGSAGSSQPLAHRPLCQQYLSPGQDPSITMMVSWPMNVRPHR